MYRESSDGVDQSSLETKVIQKYTGKLPRIMQDGVNDFPTQTNPVGIADFVSPRNIKDTTSLAWHGLIWAGMVMVVKM